MKRLLVLGTALTILVITAAPVHGSPAGAKSATAPVIALALSLREVYAGETATVRWSTENATWCRGSGMWSGAKPVQGEQQVGPLVEPGSFQLECGNGRETTSSSVRYAVLTNRPTTGLGVFDIGCNYSHSLPDDPIVFPKQRGASHMHDFFGFTRTDAFSESQQMRRILEEDPEATTCTEGVRRDGAPPASNASGYWVPAMYVNGRKVDAHHVHVYYRQELRHPVRAFAPGFKMIAGDARATPQQAKASGVIRWWCGGLNNSEVDRLPSDCAGKHGIHAAISFPACWDGRSDSPNHKDHLAYRKELGRCPESHPFRLPRILMHVDFQVLDEIGRDLRADDRITLASGGMWTMHADYLFAWDPFRLDLLVHACLNGRQNCKLDPPAITDAEQPTNEVEAPAPAPPSTPTPPSTGSGSETPGKELPADAPRLEILTTSPDAPRSGTSFAVVFAAMKGGARLEITSMHCEATAGKEAAVLKQTFLVGRLGFCVWELPPSAGKLFRATIMAHVDGGQVHKTFEATIQ